MFLRQLQKENEELKQLVTEHRSVLEKIMYKYRQDVQRLILIDHQETRPNNIINTELVQVMIKRYLCESHSLIQIEY
jgi:hypothetical protein